VTGDVVVVDVELVEDGLVEEAALLVVAAAVERLGIFEQGETEFDQPGAVGEVFVGLVQAFGQVSALAVDVSELRLDLGLGEGVVGGEVEQIVFFDVQRPDFAGELLAEESCCCLLVCDGFGDVGADVGDEAGVEPDGGVVVFDGVLDTDGVDVRGGAGAVLFVAAEEVGVLAASGVDGVLEDQALGDAGLMAAAAEQRTFEVVMVNAATFPGGGAGGDDVLDALEEVFVDEGFVASLEVT
jgi:hypothetical protein